MNQNMTYVNIMQESLARKKKYLDEILQITEQQGELAHPDKFQEDAFGELVDQKEVLINNVNEIDKGFESVYERVRSEIQQNTSIYKEKLKEIQELIRQCVETGLKIEAEEERNRATLEQTFSSKLRGVKQVKQSKKIANKYYKSMSNGAVDDMIFFDRKK